ncbi:hypothetical protein QIS99_31240 [Streptomyces sp. B-S-A8]|uniref:Uncharacterized protein n=1 Tax=Streptomyces solicavernae TaxID=3043614 RepID=A0ABT6S1T9_9ACTN|nr:hypothetical protein [Streptomyces sp. B-S-A8]MDI3390637.1 hypothetical protein [Streptomyces sp. B-S-A8]
MSQMGPCVCCQQPTPRYGHALVSPYCPTCVELWRDEVAKLQAQLKQMRGGQ